MDARLCLQLTASAAFHKFAVKDALQSNGFARNDGMLQGGGYAGVVD